MRVLTRYSLPAHTLFGLLVLLGCEDATPTDLAHADPLPSGVTANTARPHAGQNTRLVTMMDACDPETFNAAIGPDACTNRVGGITFDKFIEQLTRTQKAPSWQFAPPLTTARAGQTLLAVNRGGEFHTFTRVAEFGGGIVPPLNDLSGNPIPAPECLTLIGDDFVPPGGTYEATLNEEDTQRFECCLHPWMRTTVRVR